MPDFLPRRDNELRRWSEVFTARLLQSPEAYGITLQQAAIMGAVQAGFAQAMEVVNDRGSRTMLACLRKDAARESMVREIRKLAAVLRARNSVTVQQRLELGLRPTRRRQQRRMQAAPIAPAIKVVAVCGAEFTIRLYDPAVSSRRAWPEGANYGDLFYHIGPTPPTKAEQWQFAGHISPRFPKVVLSNQPAGTKVWLSARWTNRRGRTGPASRPLISNYGPESPRLGMVA